MEPSVLIGITLALLKELITRVCCAYKSASSSAALQQELELFHTQLLDNLHYVEDRLVHVVSCTGFTPKALEALVSEMQEFLCTAEELFERRLKHKDMRKLREDVMSTFQMRMTSAVFELQVEMYRELKERMAEKQAVQIILVQEQACGNPKLRKALSFARNTPHPTKTFQEYLKDVLASDVLPTLAAASTSKAHAIRNSEKEQKEVESVKQRQKEELKATIEEDQEKEDNKKNNPNRLMSFNRENSGKGQLGLSRCNDGKIEVIFEGPIAVRAMMGMGPMKVSKKLSYFYFEVGVVEMVELSGRSKTCPQAGVGVGLARCEEFRNDKMVGWYPKSFGYDGRIGNVQCESCPQEPFRIGILAKGDTLGIGLLQLPSQRPAIFFVKNGELQGYTQNHRFRRSSTHLLHPVVSLASRRTKLCVNFHGPFHLPSGLDLAAALDITL